MTWTGLLLAELGGVEHADLVDEIRGGMADRNGESSGEASLRSRSAFLHSGEQYGPPCVALPQLLQEIQRGRSASCRLRAQQPAAASVDHRDELVAQRSLRRPREVNNVLEAEVSKEQLIAVLAHALTVGSRHCEHVRVREKVGIPPAPRRARELEEHDARRPAVDLLGLQRGYGP